MYKKMFVASVTISVMIVGCSDRESEDGSSFSEQRSSALKISPDKARQGVSKGVKALGGRFSMQDGELTCAGDRDSFSSCLVLGGLSVGMRYAPEGRSFRDIVISQDISASLFPIAIDDDDEAYWMIGHDGKTIKFVQLSGSVKHLPYTLSGITLGSKPSEVTQVLGDEFRQVDVGQHENALNSELWDFAPNPISIEFRDDEVYSIKIYAKDKLAN